MAWYNGKFSCGHEGRVNVIGPSKDRQWKIDRKFENLCSECYEVKLENDRATANELALKLSKEMELPVLQGSEKQVEWGNTIRQSFIDKTDRFIDSMKNKKNWLYLKEDFKEFKKIEIYDLKIVLDYILENETSAKFYIDNRTDEIVAILASNVKKAIISDEDTINNKIKNEIIKEGTISPLEVKHPGVVEIKATNNKIEALYMKDDAFRAIVKSLGYEWAGIWKREITHTTGSYIDRSAELGNKLLNEGFTITIFDKEAKEKAISGDYEAECKRWIYVKNGTTKLAINWGERNDSLYNASRKLPSSRWEFPFVTIDVSRFNEVEEFSEMYGFKFTNKAIELIDKYKEQLFNTEKVNPVKAIEVSNKDGLNDILNSSREVLSDLLED